MANGEDISYRKATLEDTPRIVQLLEEGHLPSRRVEEWINAFLVATIGDEVVACGGIEIHGDTVLIRSVAVTEAARGRGIGRVLSQRLLDEALRSGASDAYLFTIDAGDYWLKQGFVDVSKDAWREPIRASWQYEVVTQRWEEFVQRGIHCMWKSLV